ncbi:protein bassoon-like [Haemorhous mexicanus]|uniref:protein bassoon-like n=1 Tax=Haemorhous mexicanus TaxID=30427 RepID=UPI0028BDF243|nr:protein bassoon-like [Haemorhous mexicanus]
MVSPGRRWHRFRFRFCSEPREPPGSGSPGAGACPGAGAGPPPGLSLPKGGTRSPGRWEVARAGLPVSLSVPACPCVSRPCVFPAVPRGPGVPAGLERCQREAEEVAELMRQNVAKALEREGHLEQLQSRAQDLRQASEAFTRTTRSVTRRQRRRYQRWHLVALGLGLLLLFILGLALALALARSSPGTVTSTVPTPQGGTKHPPSTAGTP